MYFKSKKFEKLLASVLYSIWKLGKTVADRFCKCNGFSVMKKIILSQAKNIKQNSVIKMIRMFETIRMKRQKYREDFKTPKKQFRWIATNLKKCFKRISQKKEKITKQKKKSQETKETIVKKIVKNRRKNRKKNKRRIAQKQKKKLQINEKFEREKSTTKIVKNKRKNR